MKSEKLFLAGLVVLALASCSDEEVVETSSEDVETTSGVIDLTEGGSVVPGVIRVKLESEPDEDICVASEDGSVVITGIKTLDAAGTTLKITKMERVFPDAGIYEERTRREGLHLWYNVWYEEAETSPSRATSQVSQLDGIAMAEPVYAISTREIKRGNTSNNYLLNNTWIYDDPLNDGYQWYLRNYGEEEWQTYGCDVGLPDDLWETYNGDQSVIVAVVDGGVNYEHPDLADNIYTAEDGTHGWNFVSDVADISPFYPHATHVAGLIAATNNNGVGISSIAGGDGTADSGVKLMICQIIDTTKPSATVDYAAAIKYGADNGAVISQNSWGYATAQETAQTEKDAIDYFVKYAGCDSDGNQLESSPMKGGVVLFASGNTNTSNVTYAAPADYENVVAVAALDANNVKASYSNYGEYMDICAPGGETSLDEEAWIYSTYGTSGYDYLAGTSMSCPLVSAACALIIEKNGVGKQGFTANDLLDILYGSATDIDDLNPDYEGLLGAGALNLEQALSMDVDDVVTFTLKSSQISDGNLTFKVSSALAGDGQLQIYNGTGYKVYDAEVTLKIYSWYTLDVSALSAGYYTLKYSCNGKSAKANFVKY